MIWTTGFTQHISFNASKAYVRQLDRSYEYKALQPVYALSLVNDIFEPAKEAYYHHYQIVNIEDTGKKLEGLEFVFVELPKFKASNITEKKLQLLWLRFMTEIDENIAEAPAEFLENKEIMEALKNLQFSGFTKAELETYDKYWDSIRTEKTLHSGFYDKGKAEGKAEEKKEIARTALKMGMHVQDITKLTGLSEGEIMAL